MCVCIESLANDAPATYSNSSRNCSFLGLHSFRGTLALSTARAALNLLSFFSLVVVGAVVSANTFVQELQLVGFVPSTAASKDLTIVIGGVRS